VASTSSWLGASATLRLATTRPRGHSGSTSINPLSEAALSTVRTKLIGPLVRRPSVCSDAAKARKSRGPIASSGFSPKKARTRCACSSRYRLAVAGR
jgi:hypothetical protein